jgi:hypothetical protein
VSRLHHRGEIILKTKKPKASKKDKRNFLWGMILTGSAIVAITSAALAVRACDRAAAVASLAA